MLGGLWPATAGKIYLPKQIFFLPQKPYLLLGRSLAAQILYPAAVPEGRVSEDISKCISTLLQFLSLDRFIPTMHIPSDFENVLSGGEQQRYLYTSDIFWVQL